MPDATGQLILAALKEIRDDHRATLRSVSWMRGHTAAQWALILLMAAKVFGK